MNKVIIIGWDGATFDIIRPMVAEGKLPNVARLMRAGAQGELRSTMPPMTFPAWSSFMTGKNPGKHGIFDFTEHKPGTYEVQFVNAKRRAGKTLWQILSDAGKRVCVMGVPVTFPPDPINGVMICGFESPGAGGAVDENAVYPPELLAELNQKLGGYRASAQIKKDVEQNNLGVALNKILDTIESKARTALYLFEKEEWDCFMVLFGESDLAGHYFWRYHDPQSPRYDPTAPDNWKNAMRVVYEKLDEVVGRFISRIPHPASVVVMSDHGFGGTGNKILHVNRWLEQEGFLAFRQCNAWQRTKTATLNAAKMAALKFLPAWVRRELFRRRSKELVSRAESFLRFGDIAWQKTQAYAEENPYYPAIWLNVKGREPQGVVEPGADYERVRRRLIERLSSWRDPQTGAPIVEAVWRREEIYHGDCVERAPDLVVKWALDGGYNYAYRPSRQGKLPVETLSAAELNGVGFRNKNGNHRDDGILIMAGEAVKEGERLIGANVVDLAPTILHLLDVPIPDDMDGRVLTEALSTTKAVTTIKADDSEDNQFEEAYTAEESEKVKETLRGLGYID
jgi:predicted AlkP superfamily phosphohydrolase/phosphomutase